MLCSSHFRQNVLSVKQIQQCVRSAKGFGKTSFGKMAFQRSVLSAKWYFSKNVFRWKVHSAKWSFGEESFRCISFGKVVLAKWIRWYVRIPLIFTTIIYTYKVWVFYKFSIQNLRRVFCMGGWLSQRSTVYKLIQY